MMKKRVFSILLAFVMALCLLPAQKAKADGTSEKACSFCGQALSVHASVSKHYYRCENSACSNYYDGSDSSKQIPEEHSLDGDCKCSVCGWYKHATTIFNDGVHKAPTCTEPGVDIDGQCWYCVNCKKYFSLVYSEYPSPETGTYTPALGHDWATTLTNGGSTHYYACSRCDAKKDEAAHNYVWSYVDDDTCKGVCACGAETTVEHVWNGSHWCGYPRKCKDCGEYYGEVLDHEYWYEYKTDEQHKINCYHCDGFFGREDHSGGTATCIAKAVCEKCKAEYGEYAAHKGGTATCTEKAVCEICGQEYGDPLDHDWATAWTQGDTTHYYACSRCTERKDEAPHSYSWTYVDDNTCKGECTCGATTTEAHYDRWASFCDYQPHCEKCDHDYGPRNEHSMYYVDKGESGHKPYCYNCDTYFFVESHSGGEATCTSKAKCEKCGADYGDLAEHTGGKATCTEKAKCTVCGQPYGDVDPNNHDLINHEAKAPTCTEIGWDAYDTCSRCDYTTYVEKKALDHDLVHHDAQAPTCTEIGWDAYDTCSRCDYTTYIEKRALDHDMIHHDAQAPNCTEIGWDAYDTCSRCDYTTYVEKKALDHDLVHHDAQAPNCTEIGWDAYDTCSRCDYTTYKEIAALGHTEVVDEAIAPTCTETGLTEGSHCSVCGEILTVQASIPALGHRYGLWEHAESGKHQARCTRCGAVAKVDCAHIALPQTDPDAEPITLCPICGHRDNADDLVRVTDAKAKGAYGNLVVFITGEDEPNRFLTVAFEWNGRLVQPRNTVTVTLPAELLDSCDLLLIASDGTETQLVPEITGDLTTFTLDFVVENERLLARLLRMQQKA